MAYRTALELDPKNALAWSELGHLFYGAGAYDEAMRSYLKSIEFNQGSNEAYGKLASIYNLKGLHAEAVPLLLKGLEFSDKDSITAQLWNLLGDAYRKLDDYENATAAYRKADTFAPKTDLPQTELSTPSQDTQLPPPENNSDQTDTKPELTPVMDEFVPSLDNTPDDDENLSDEQHTPVEEEALSSEFSIYRDEKPLTFESSAPSVKSLAEEADTPGDVDARATAPDEAFVEWLDGLASVLPVTSSSETLGENGMTVNEDDSMDKAGSFESGNNSQEQKTGDADAPIEYEFSYSNASTDFDPASHFLSDMSFEVQSSETEDESLISSQPTEESDPAMEDDPQESPTLDNMTIFDVPDFRAGKLTGEDTGPAQVTIDQKNAQIWNELGNIYYNTGAFDEAMHAFQMAIELDPSFGWSFNNLASVYFHQKRYEDAIPLYQKGLELLDDFKDQALLWNRLGDAYRRVDQHDQAAAAYRKAMELDPDNVSLLTRARFSLLGNRRN